jgi:hypothetical protein
MARVGDLVAGRPLTPGPDGPVEGDVELAVETDA